MAKIKAGILSKVSGKVAGVVGGTWKGTNYLRELVKPANPNTPLQQAQRAKMSFVVACARQLVGDILNPYLNKFCKTMSGYNWFCKENIKKLGGTPLAFTSAPVLSFGTLASGTLDAGSLSTYVSMVFTAVPSVASGHTLKVVAAIIDENGNVLQKTEQESPIADDPVQGLDTDDIAAGTKFYGVAFFADYDANGVLQQISASVATSLRTKA